MKTFKLPDLGEGLHEAEIVEWQVSVGDEVSADDPLVSVETAKAIVEVPAPWAGKIAKLHGSPGDIIETGSPLVEFESGEDEPAKEEKKEKAPDSGTVVGAVQSGNEQVREKASQVSQGGQKGVRATPAVRALARRKDVDLSVVTPSGPNGLITAADVERVARILGELGPAEPLRGPRRAMAGRMAAAHAEVAATTVVDDAVVHGWAGGTNSTLRLARAIVAGCRAEPALNAWFDSHSVARRVIGKIDLGIAVDTEDGLFVPVLRDIGNRDADDIREGFERMKADVRARKVPPEEMRGQTITLSNFGAIGARYAALIVVPPTVAILGAGRTREEVVAVDGEPAVRRVMPLSVTFDHRAVTGGEATRFLMAVKADLEKDD